MAGVSLPTTSRDWVTTEILLGRRVFSWVESSFRLSSSEHMLIVGSFCYRPRSDIVGFRLSEMLYVLMSFSTHDMVDLVYFDDKDIQGLPVCDR